MKFKGNQFCRLRQRKNSGEINVADLDKGNSREVNVADCKIKN